MTERYPTQDERLQTATAGRIDDIDEARAMAEASKGIRAQIAEVRVPGSWLHNVQKEDQDTYVEKRNDVANELERWAGILHNLPQDELDRLMEATYHGSIFSDLTEVHYHTKGRVHYHLTAESVSRTIQAIEQTKKAFKRDDEETAKLPVFDQAKKYSERLLPIRLLDKELRTPESLYTYQTRMNRDLELQTKAAAILDNPNATVGELLEFSKNAYLEHFVKPVMDDLATKKFLLQSLEKGIVPTPEDLVDATPNNQGLIARSIRQIQAGRDTEKTAP